MSITRSDRAVRVLGGFELIGPGGIPEFGRSGLDLVKLLAVTTLQARTQLQLALWPEADQVTASSRLRSLLYRIKRQTGEEIVRPIGTSSLRLSPELHVDYAIAIATARAIIGGTHLVSESTVELVDLLGRELLPADSSEWLRTHQAAWSRARLWALASLVHASAESGNWTTVALAGERVIEAEPFNEDVHYLMVLGLLREGFLVSARSLYDRLAQRLDLELSCRPQRTFGELRSGSTHSVLVR